MDDALEVGQTRFFLILHVESRLIARMNRVRDAERAVAGLTRRLQQ